MSAAVRLAVIMAGLLALANCEIQSLSQVKKVPFTACIDDSDCAGQGQDFACFQYLCYPWKDDSKLPKAGVNTWPKMGRGNRFELNLAEKYI